MGLSPGVSQQRFNVLRRCGRQGVPSRLPVHMSVRRSTVCPGLLGTHIGRGSHHHARISGIDLDGRGLTLPTHRLRRLQLFGKAEIKHLDLAFGRDLNSGRLQVAVDHTSLMCRGFCIGHLPATSRNFLMSYYPGRSATAPTKTTTTEGAPSRSMGLSLFSR